MNYTKRLYNTFMKPTFVILLAGIFFLQCSQSKHSIYINPPKNKIYAYQISNYTKRLWEDIDEELQNQIEFEFIVVGKSKDGFNLELKVTKMDLEQDDENPDFNKFIEFVNSKYIGQPFPFLLRKNGKIEFINPVTESLDQRMEKINDITDDKEYQEAFYALAIEDLNTNLLNEWLAYAPSKGDDPNKWRINNPLSYGGITNNERNFLWKIVEQTPDSIVLNGSNKMTIAESKQDMGNGIKLVTRFTGLMEFNARLVIDPKDGMLIYSENRIFTNGDIHRYAEGLPEGRQPDVGVEPLQGTAITYIKRKEKS